MSWDRPNERRHLKIDLLERLISLPPGRSVVAVEQILSWFPTQETDGARELVDELVASDAPLSYETAAQQRVLVPDRAGLSEHVDELRKPDRD